MSASQSILKILARQVADTIENDIGLAGVFSNRAILIVAVITQMPCSTSYCVSKTTLRANHLATPTNLIIFIEARFTKGLTVIGRLMAFVSVNPLVAIRTLSIVLFKTTLTNTSGFALTGHFPHFGFLVKLVAVVTGVVMLSMAHFTN